MRILLPVAAAVLFLTATTLYGQTPIPCETKAYFNPNAQEVVYQQNLPTPWWGVKMNVEWTATIDTAVICLGITRSSGTGQDTIDVRVLKDTLPKFFILDQMSLGLVPNLNGNIPDGQYIIEFSFQQPLGWVDPPGDFWLSWRLRGPSSHIGRTFMRKPAIHPQRSVVINDNGTTVLATDYAHSQVQDSVDLCAEAHVCYPYGTPVELQTFTVTYRNGRAVLDWATATETINYGFQVERLAGEQGNLRVWQNIGFVEGHGTTTEPHRYAFVDPHPELVMDSEGVVRYRLRQVDLDGSSQLSPVVALYIPSSAQGFSLDQNYPNPLSMNGSGTMIGFTLDRPAQVQLRLYDAIGREAAVIAEGEFDRGYHAVPFAASLPAGVYYYTLLANGQRLSRRLTVTE